jgi:(E)-4-hydroxy-3-methylbut-2-enyl-diphosphate synthase
MADIHFDYRIALSAIEYGIDSLRLNPGNIREPEYVKKVVDAVKEKNMTVRIGVNSGSINRKKYPHPTPEALVDSAFEHIKIFEQENFFNIIVSLKSTDVLTTIRAYEIFSKKSDYPLHIGITEAGTQFSGAIKSSVGIGVLLYEGLGDTLRVSLSGNPVTEVTTGYKILQALGLREHGVEVIACPTCGRAEIDVEKIALDIENSTSNINKHIKIAVMGCIVNGPGEAMDADVGVACSKNEAIIFKKGKIIKKITHNQIKDELINAIEA